ncbi:MAG: DUF2780 domain-containing protein [Sulfurimonas sp.]
MKKSLLLSVTLTTALTISSAAAFSLGDAAGALSSMTSTASTPTATKTAPTTQATSSNALVGMLSSQLGVSDKQAAGGVGSILSYAQGSLPSNDYTKLASAVPDASSMLSMAPKSTNALSALGSLGGAASSATSMAGLASQFSSLGLDSGMISKFIPIMMDYFKQSGSTGAMGILSGLFSK